MQQFEENKNSRRHKLMLQTLSSIQFNISNNKNCMPPPKKNPPKSACPTIWCYFNICYWDWEWEWECPAGWIWQIKLYAVHAVDAQNSAADLSFRQMYDHFCYSSRPAKCNFCSGDTFTEHNHTQLLTLTVTVHKWLRSQGRKNMMFNGGYHHGKFPSSCLQLT